MPRSRNATRSAPSSYALSACNFFGRLRGRPRLPRNRGEGIPHLKHLLAVVDVRPGERHRERQPAAVYHLMAFRARFAPIRRVRADRTPFLRGAPLARTLTESMLARLP